jgi:squalene-associated FAD-dependent desaturase
VFLACCDQFIRFVDRVGMTGHLHLQERFEVLALAKNGVRSRLRAASLPAPLHLVISFLGYKHLNWAGRLQIARALAQIKSALKSDASFLDWLRQHGQGDDAIRAFWDPFVVPALNASLDRVSAADAAFVIVTAFMSDAGAARFGFSTLPLAHIMAAAAARADRVELQTAVLGIELGERPEDGVTLRLAGDERRRYDGVVLAVPPNAVAKLVEDPQRFGLPPLDGYEAKPIIDIHLWHDGGAMDFDFATLLGSPVQWIFQKEPGYFCCSVSAADEFLTRPTAEVVAMAWDEVREALPELAHATLRNDAVTRNPNSTYLAKPGVHRPSQRTSQPNVVVAGSWTETGWPDTMESAVRSGIAASAFLRTSLERIAPVPSAVPVQEVPAVG